MRRVRKSFPFIGCKCTFPKTGLDNIPQGNSLGANGYHCLIDGLTQRVKLWRTMDCLGRQLQLFPEYPGVALQEAWK